MTTWFAVFLLAATASAAANAQALTADSLQGTVIEAMVEYETAGRRGGMAFTGARPVWRMRLSIGAGGSYQANITRTGNFQGRSLGTMDTSVSGVIGKPQQQGGSHSVLIVSGHTVTLLRTLQVGGFKATVTLTPDRKNCTIHAPLAREVGAGDTRMRHASGRGNVEVTSSRQVSQTCRVSR